MPDTLRGINDDDWDNMDWADGIKPGEAVTVMGESGLNRVWNAPDLGFRPVMTGRPKGVYSKDSFGGKDGVRLPGTRKMKTDLARRGRTRRRGGGTARCL